MKNLFSILLLTLTLSASAQWYKSEAFKTVTLYSASIVLDAVGDGLNDSGQKVGGHALNAMSTGLLVASPFILDVDKHNWGWYAASYVSLRVGLFDMSYNATRGLPLQYVGNSSIYDKTVAATKSPDSWLFAGRTFFLSIGIIIPINEL
jgi:hypothetical protein